MRRRVPVAGFRRMQSAPSPMSLLRPISATAAAGGNTTTIASSMAGVASAL